jgi:hypothetical protein
VVQEVVEAWEDKCGHSRSILEIEGWSWKICPTSQTANEEHCNAGIYIPCIQNHVIEMVPGMVIV